MKITTKGLTWPLRFLPAATPPYAGTYPMVVPGCNRTYNHRTIALHLFDYDADLWIGKKHLHIQPGDITLSTGVSRYELRESGTHLCIHFEPSSGVERSPVMCLPLHFRLGPRVAAARERFWHIIDHARQSGEDPTSPAGCAASAALQELLLWLFLQSRQGTIPHRSSLIDQALGKLGQAIESSLAEPMLIGDLAKGVGLSADYVARLFARRYGMTLQHYLLQRRIELARHLLISSDFRVFEIGRQVGLPDPQYFNKQFRRVVGQSPVAFRQQNSLSASGSQNLESTRASAEKPRRVNRSRPRSSPARAAS